MNNDNHSSHTYPDFFQIEEALAYEKEKELNKYVYKKLAFGIIILLAILLVIVIWFLPLISIEGSSMSPTLHNGDIILSSERDYYKPGDIIVFQHHNTVLVKRIIASGGDIVDIDEFGNVFVNEKQLDESYLLEKSQGTYDIEFPYQVPEHQYFVMGDNRASSTDSRVVSIGTISEDKILGKAALKLWPLGEFELLD